jgi:SAM-dependent methyltransferase
VNGVPDVPPEILAHYEAFPERERLSAGDGLLEKLRTQQILRRCLPRPPATVLDVGGGPGVYAVWLAGLGYSVHLIDPVARHVIEAEDAAETVHRTLASAAVGDARSLDAETGSMDSVLMLGPLYHLTEAADRRRALAEAARVLRDDGVLVAAAISRFAPTLDGLDSGAIDDPRFRDIIDQDLDSGQHRNPTGEIRYFTTAFMHHPGGLRAEVAAAGFEDVEVVAVEGIGWVAGDLDARLRDPATRDSLLDLVGRLESEPSLLGASPHVIAIGRRR